MNNDVNDINCQDAGSSRSETVTVQYGEGGYYEFAVKLVALSRMFISKIYLYFDEKEYNAKSVLGINAANIPVGTRVRITANGKDANDAVRELAKFMESGESARLEDGKQIGN